MASFLSGLLGMSEQELRFHVQRAIVWAIALLLNIFPALSPLLSASSSSWTSPPPSVSPEFLALSPLPQPAQHLEGQSGEQTHAPSDALAFQSSTASSSVFSEADQGKQQVLVPLSETVEAEPQRGERSRNFFSEEGLAEIGKALSCETSEGQCVCSEEALSGEGEATSQGEERDTKTVTEGDEAAVFPRAKEAACITLLDGRCLAQIMSHVDNKTLQRCSLVSHEWLEASNFSRTKMSLHIQKAPSAAALPMLLARFSRLRTLQIHGPKLPSEDASLTDAEHPATEQASTVSVNDPAMALIAQSCSGLRKLRLKHCSGVSDLGLQAVLRGCPELLTLRLEYCGGFSGEAAFNNLRCSLGTLAFNDCLGLTNEGLLAATEACPNLITFSVCTERLDASLARGLEGAARVCRNLQRLMLHFCGVDDVTLRSFATSCPLLNTVTISCEHSVTDGGLEYFFSRLPELGSVTLQSNTGVSRIPSFRDCSRLKQLNLVWMWEVPDQGFCEVGKESTVEELLLECCYNLSDASVEKILSGCRSLKRLVLSNNDMITTEAVKAYVKSASTARLEIRQCTGVSKEGLSQDVLNMERLQIVS